MPAQWIALAVATLAAAMGLGLLLGLDGCSHPSASIRLGRRSRDAGLCLLLRACSTVRACSPRGRRHDHAPRASTARYERIRG